MLLALVPEPPSISPSPSLPSSLLFSSSNKIFTITCRVHDPDAINNAQVFDVSDSATDSDEIIADKEAHRALRDAWYEYIANTLSEEDSEESSSDESEN